jgi:large subunit ribosomal protein L18
MLKGQEKRLRRHRRIRAKVKGTAEIPRLCAFRSGRHIYAQLIDDEKGRTLVSASDAEVKGKTKKTKSDLSREVGKLIAQKSLAEKFEKVVFDRGGYQYHGRIKNLAEGAREGGLKF